MLSEDTKKKFRQALASKGLHDYAEELIAAIDSQGSGPASHVGNITSSDLVGVDGTGSNAAPLAGTETRLDALEAKVNEILAALQASGQMASS